MGTGTFPAVILFILVALAAAKNSTESKKMLMCPGCIDPAFLDYLQEIPKRGQQLVVDKKLGKWYCFEGQSRVVFCNVSCLHVRMNHLATDGDELETMHMFSCGFGVVNSLPGSGVEDLHNFNGEKTFNHLISSNLSLTYTFFKAEESTIEVEKPVKVLDPSYPENLDYMFIPLIGVVHFSTLKKYCFNLFCIVAVALIILILCVFDNYLGGRFQRHTPRFFEGRVEFSKRKAKEVSFIQLNEPVDAETPEEEVISIYFSDFGVNRE